MNNVLSNLKLFCMICSHHLQIMPLNEQGAQFNSLRFKYLCVFWGICVSGQNAPALRVNLQKNIQNKWHVDFNHCLSSIHNIFVILLKHIIVKLIKRETTAIQGINSFYWRLYRYSFNYSVKRTNLLQT